MFADTAVVRGPTSLVCGAACGVRLSLPRAVRKLAQVTQVTGSHVTGCELGSPGVRIYTQTRHSSTASVGTARFLFGLSKENQIIRGPARVPLGHFG